MSGQQIARRPDRTPLSQRDPIALAQHFAQSGFFRDAADMSKAVVKIVAGEELGIGPMAAMTGIYIIEGKPSLSANLLAAQVKRSEHYDYRVRKSTDTTCAIEFFEDGESVGISEFTIEQARKIKTKEHGKWIPLADTLRWENSPIDMLFARALTRGVRQFCPDVTAGSPAYVPEELGAEVNGDGDPVYVETEVEVVNPEPTEAPTLSEETVAVLLKGYEIAGPELSGVTPLDGLNLILGSLGIDAFEPGDDLREQFAALAPEQADAINAEFERALEAEGVAEAGVGENGAEDEGVGADADA